MNESMKKTTLILVWITILVIILSISAARFYIVEQHNNLIASQKVQQSMGAACIKHLQNLTSSANANQLDIGSYGLLAPSQNSTQAYGLGTNPSLPSGKYILWQATLQCLTDYPLYYNNSSSLFNLSLR